MQHLFASRADVLRLKGDLVNGSIVQEWVTVGQVTCRLDLNFVRPGKDQPPAIVAGRAPDRVGLMFFMPGVDVRAGDHIRTVSGPVDGTFEVRVVPDPAVGYGTAHHMEVQVVEVSQALAGLFPGSRVEETP